jgi:hypothetical protein
VAERSKAHAWKVCIPQKGIVGSNPTSSARTPSLGLQYFPHPLISLNFGIAE